MKRDHFFSDPMAMRMLGKADAYRFVAFVEGKDSALGKHYRRLMRINALNAVSFARRLHRDPYLARIYVRDLTRLHPEVAQ